MIFVTAIFEPSTKKYLWPKNCCWCRRYKYLHHWNVWNCEVTWPASYCVVCKEHSSSTRTGVCNGIFWARPTFVTGVFGITIHDEEASVRVKLIEKKLTQYQILTQLLTGSSSWDIYHCIQNVARVGNTAFLRGELLAADVRISRCARASQRVITATLTCLGIFTGAEQEAGRWGLNWCNEFDPWEIFATVRIIACNLALWRIFSVRNRGHQEDCRTNLVVDKVAASLTSSCWSCRE